MTFGGFLRFSALAAALLAAGCGERDATSDPALEQSGEGAVWAHEASDIPADEAVRYGVLDNGMRYAIVENDTPSGTAALRLVLNVGSFAETDAQRGLAHFIEHMAFNGTTNVPEGEMVPLLERYGLAFGPDTNAFTSRELVGYQLDLPSVEEEVVNVGLFLMRETASEMLMDAEAIDRERGVILGEERYRNTPIRRFFNAYYDFLYPDTLVVERDPIGTVEVIETAPAAEFEAYYQDYYAPERAMLVVAGDIDADIVEEKIRNGFEIDIEGVDLDRVEGFSTWRQPEDAGPDPDIGEVAEFDEPGFGFFHDPDIYTLINVDVVTPGEPEADTRETRRRRMLRSLGNAIVQRRLQSEINSGESPLVQASLSYSNDFELANRAGVFAVSSPDRWREGVAAVEQELRRAVEHGFTQAELDEQLANLRTALRNAADEAETRRSANLADKIWQAWINENVYDHPDFALAFFEAFEPEITVEAVEAAFREIWTAAPPQVFVAANQEIENGDAAVREAWLSSTAEMVEPPEEGGATEFAYTDFGEPGAVVSSQTVEDLGVEQYVFDNGVRLNVKTTDFEDNNIRVRVDFGAGDLAPQPTPAAGSIVGAVFGGGGLEAHDRDELERLLAGRSVGYGVGVTSDSFYFSQSTTPTDFELQMQVLTAFMTAPGWRDDALNRFRAIADEIRRGQNAQAVQVAINRVSRMLRSGDPRWGFPTQEEIEAFTMDDARALLGDALDRAPIEVTIVGDIEAERAVDAVAATFGALADRAEEWPAYEENRRVSFPEPNEEPEIVRFNGQSYQGMANVYWPTDDAIDARRARAIDLMAAVLDLKATDRFREREGATYSAIVSNQESDVFEDYGFLWMGLDVQVDDIPRMYEIADELAASMAAGEVTEDELLRARQPILESIEEARETNGFWLNALRRSQTDPDRLDRLRSLESDYRAVTVEEVVALASEFLQPERAWRASILPEDMDAADSGAGD
ncbi:insulinase family protein [Marinicauda salina]|uniref:Insulinase family protein n=1 Tax=Marinicauda salina TaxID=2135793 RepID=A0A2U2BVQ3_9PROT|nr:M16 family metallopeptidase [Marinicauda salina]PWE18044.1 insulinase family protein [Marinicauda salina]